ncbi:unnamed protein product [Camellia sinensis]
MLLHHCPGENPVSLKEFLQHYVAVASLMSVAVILPSSSSADFILLLWPSFLASVILIIYLVFALS